MTTLLPNVVFPARVESPITSKVDVTFADAKVERPDTPSVPVTFAPTSVVSTLAILFA